MKRIFFALAATFALSTSFHKVEHIQKTDAGVVHPAPVATSQSDSVAISKKSADAALYEAIDFADAKKLDFSVFQKAFTGFNNLKKAGKLSANAHILSICDFSLSSNIKRLWVIDTDSKKVLFHSLVAHGKNTGEEFASSFSNAENSLQSSLGFYITEDTYDGENGYSLRLEGMDEGYNDAAMRRSIVMHGADYVSEGFAAEHQRIGRSWGCPAVPRALAEPIINTVKGQSCLFIYYPDQNYLRNSRWLNS